MKKKVNAFDLIQKIEKIAKERITQSEVVTLDQFRSLKNKLDPHVILLIEDDEGMHTLLKRILPKEDGFDLRIASDGTELAHLLDEITPDLILMDIGLPWINGFELTELIKTHREMRKIPVLMVSGHSSDEDVKRAFTCGADDFIKKPFTPEELKSAVLRYLNTQS
ncbi:MAG: response regulator [Bdellovibrionaceae bacterium]|jgi:two-component system aerobic respiration control protein ArcA|nr:response regulator [Pseudobdellovibrionaceae bacterium]